MKGIKPLGQALDPGRIASLSDPRVGVKKNRSAQSGVI
jgi:hypothetical protein